MAHSIDTKFIKIGNSQGVRLPKSMVLAIGSNEIHVEEKDGIISISAKRKRPPISEWGAIMDKRAAEGKIEIHPDDALWNSISGDTLRDEQPWEENIPSK